MPIRAENRSRYPRDWPALAARIRFARAAGRCECEGECGADHRDDPAVFGGGEDIGPPARDRRCWAYHGHAHPLTGAVVVLTVAHLDHTPEHCDDGNLKAMCQRCHNRLARACRAGIVARARAGRAAGDLF